MTTCADSAIIGARRSEAVSAQYPIRAVAKLTGITVDTLRAWERRYQAVTPDRSAGGRLYSDSDVRRLRLLRSALEGGYSIGKVASLPDAELEELARASPPSNGDYRSETSPRRDPPALQALFSAIESFDHATASEELGRLALLSSPTDLVHKVVLPLMRLAGENWERGTFQMAQEHMLSACVRSLLGSLVRLRMPGSAAAKLLLTTPSDELHEFGILCAALLAVAHDCQVAYLGPNLPAREILSAADKCAPRVVVLGITKTNATPSVCHDVSWLASELPATIELWVGGAGAAEVVDGVERGAALVLEDLKDFERHLVGRLKAWKESR